MYDINFNYLGVSPQESGGKKEEERVVEGESFLFALLSGQEGTISYLKSPTPKNYNFRRC